MKIVLVLCALVPLSAAAQEPTFPNRAPLEITVLFPAGSSADVTARMLADGMSRHLNQRVHDVYANQYDVRLTRRDREQMMRAGLRCEFNAQRQRRVESGPSHAVDARDEWQAGDRDRSDRRAGVHGSQRLRPSADARAPER